MPGKKVDERLRALLASGLSSRSRSLVVLVGDRGKEQAVNIHALRSKLFAASPPTGGARPRTSVLWCYSRDLGFSTHRGKTAARVRKLAARGLLGAAGGGADGGGDPFEMFIATTAVRWCYYKETHRVLGSTFGMAVLQDFEALTPNLLCVGRPRRAAAAQRARARASILFRNHHQPPPRSPHSSPLLPRAAAARSRRSRAAAWPCCCCAPCPR
jgi:hypothetical protein